MDPITQIEIGLVVAYLAVSLISNFRAIWDDLTN